jgi:tRNA threonylcarbamoyladenosine biosynthesis protein TsaB
MKILGIDTSTSWGSIGLVDGDSTIAECLLNIPVTHSERLLPSIDSVLKQGGYSIEDLDGWAVSLGPGSFTGLRIGVSTIKGLAFATQRPVAGVPTLDALAANVAPTPYLICPILDAKKGEVYTAFYRYEADDSPKRLSEDQAIRPEDLVRKIAEKTIFLGSGVKTYGGYLCRALPALAAFARGPLNLPHGSVVAKLGLERLQRNDSLHLATFTPIYVRASEAEIKWKEKHPQPPQP